MLLLLLACVDVPSTGKLLEPVKVTGGATAGAPGAAAPGAGPTSRPPSRPSGPQGDFDFEADGRPEGEGAAPEAEATDAEADPLVLQARLLGLSPDAVPKAPAPAAAPAPMALPPVAAPLWDPSRPLPDVSFGVRVLGVLLDLQPPRAVLGLPDGREQVVTPGAMLPAEGLVVLAIGRDAVQVARITPAGFYARVDTETIRALYPQQAPTVP